VTYLDSSIVLARLFVEPQEPTTEFWGQPLISSRLLIYEVWSRLGARGLYESHGRQALAIFDRVALLEMTPAVLDRALRPFSMPVRTLDGLHLASMVHLQSANQSVHLASYDNRLNAVALTLGIPLVPLRKASP
jgi:hypothetical protein